MVEKQLTVHTISGLHMRPASRISQVALEYESRIMLRFHNREFNVKSLLSMLSACVQQNDEVILSCSGPDEEEAMRALLECFEEE